MNEHPLPDCELSAAGVRTDVLELGGHLVLLQVQLEHPALLEGRGAAWLAALWGRQTVEELKTTAACCSMSSWAMTRLQAFWRSCVAFWRHLVVVSVETDLEVLVLVAVAVAHVSLQFVRGEKTLRASRKLASVGKLS